MSTEEQNQYLDFLIDPSFQGVNTLFVLSLENEGDKKVHTGYHLAKLEIKDRNVMIYEKNFLDQPVKSDERTYDNIQKIATGQGDDYTTACLLDYTYFKDHYKMTATDLSKQQALDAEKAIQQINFTVNPEHQSTKFFIIEEAKETVLDFLQGAVKVFYFYVFLKYKKRFSITY